MHPLSFRQIHTSVCYYKYSFFPMTIVLWNKLSADLVQVSDLDSFKSEVSQKELFILFAASSFRKLSSIYVFSYFPFGFEGRIWDLIVSVPDHCLSFYFTVTPFHK